MPSSEIQDRIWAFFSEPTPEIVSKFEVSFAAASEGERDPRPAEFSFFSEEHAHRACELYEDWFKQTDDFKVDDAIESVLSRCEERRQNENPALVGFALMVFITHTRGADKYVFPPLGVREPWLVLPSSYRPPNTTVVGGSTEPEDRLDWYREDPLLNEHHEHWHIVYPFTGVFGKTRDRQGEIFFYMHQQMLARYDTERIAVGLPRVTPFDDPSKPMVTGYRPGAFVQETFPYHSERPAGLTLRDINRPMYGLPGRFGTDRFIYTVAEHDGVKARLMEAVESGYLHQNGRRIAITADLLGHTLEASRIGSIDASYYGSYHNNGHRLIAVSHDPTGDSPLGVMSRPETSFRDPIFYEWHKHIDAFSFRLQETAAPHDFSDHPPVYLRKGFDEVKRLFSPDLILCRQADLDPILEAGHSFTEIGETAFGGSHWNHSFAKASGKVGEFEFSTSDTLFTSMEDDYLSYVSEGQEHQVPYRYLTHEPFVYFFRIENRFPEERDVTVRVFLVLEEWAKDRRMYIELDKFRHRLGARDNARNVVARADALSSIIRKPAITHPGEYSRQYDPSFGDWILRPFRFSEGALSNPEQAAEKILEYATDLRTYRRNRFGEEGNFREFESRERSARREVESNPKKETLSDYEAALRNYFEALSQFNYDRAYCGCGYPYSLLLPRGTAEGMSVNLWVMVTDWELDRVEDDTCCTSMSFCGAKDRYPDVRPMGYPFDRSFPEGVEQALSELPNAAGRGIKILCRNTGSVESERNVRKE